MHAREALAGKWGLAVGATFVSTLISVIARVVPLLPIFISGAMALGMAIFSIAISRNTNPHFEQIFEGFKKFGTSLAAFLLMVIYIVLWTLLLVIPGIIAALSYSMTFYIIADDNTIRASDAIRASKKMMMGNKWKLFCLGFRFLGWAILACFTLGIGFLWLLPYMQVSFAKFYDEVKGGEAEVAKV